MKKVVKPIKCTEEKPKLHEWYVGDSESGYNYKSDEAALAAAKNLMKMGLDEIIIQRATE